MFLGGCAVQGRPHEGAIAAGAIGPTRAESVKSEALPARNTGHYATIETDRGSIVVELYPSVAPKTVANFEKLAKDGFYNNQTFHRGVPGFAVQGGDPQGNGSGGPSYDIPAEISTSEKHLRGTLATARLGDNVNPERKSSGSQFYICLEPQPGLDGQYTIFGGVVKGMDVVDQIREGDHMKKITLTARPGARVVYVYRPYNYIRDFRGGRDRASVMCGPDRARIGPGGYYAFVVPAGKVICSLDTDFSGSDNIEVDAGPGAYYFKVSNGPGGFTLNSIDAGVAPSEIQKCCLEEITKTATPSTGVAQPSVSSAGRADIGKTADQGDSFLQNGLQDSRDRPSSMDETLPKVPVAEIIPHARPELKPHDVPTSTQSAVAFSALVVHERRIALVIGNTDYRHVSRLANPSNDAKLIEAKHQDEGFKLVGGKALIDLDKPAFERALEKFGDEIQQSKRKGATVALFYYAGHGMQINGVNYLVPISANPSKAADAPLQMVQADVALNQMEDGGARLKIMILDACRNNPFRGISRKVGGGLAGMDAPDGTLIAYATKPDGVAADGDGRDSPYTEALVEAFHKPGLGLFDVFNEAALIVKRKTSDTQQPWHAESAIEGKFCFAGCLD